eukprot:352677-Chlamydomonas_euryale.AAC.5
MTAAQHHALAAGRTTPWTPWKAVVGVAQPHKCGSPFMPRPLPSQPSPQSWLPACMEVQACGLYACAGWLAHLEARKDLLHNGRHDRRLGHVQVAG